MQVVGCLTLCLIFLHGIKMKVKCISLLIDAQHVSVNNVSIIRSWRLRDVIASCWYVPWLQEGCQDRLVSIASVDALTTNRTWPPSCSHGTYQHKAITSRSRQLLMMDTLLPETCWATIRREIKNAKSDIQLVFLIHTELRCTVNHTSELCRINVYDFLCFADRTSQYNLSN